MALEQFGLDGQVAIALEALGSFATEGYATNAVFHVDGGIDSNNSPLPIPDY